MIVTYGILIESLSCVTSSPHNAGEFCLLVLWKPASLWWDTGGITDSELTKCCWNMYGWSWTSVFLGWAYLNVLQLLKLHLCKWFPGLKAPHNFVTLHMCVSVCRALRNKFKAFGNGLFPYWECCMRWLAADLAARLTFLVHDLTEHCNYSHKRLVLILGLALDLNCRLLEYWWWVSEAKHYWKSWQWQEYN